MAHDYKSVKDALEAIAPTVGICEVVAGFDKTIDSKVKFPALRFDSQNSTEDTEQDTEVFDLVFELFQYYHRGGETQEKDYDDIWRELETIASNFFTALHGYDNKFEILTPEISKTRFGYGRSVNNTIPIRFEFQLKVYC